MTAPIKTWFLQRNLNAPGTLAEVIRCIYDSLALEYSHVLAQLSEIPSLELKSLRIVGGGVQNEFLNQLCADVFAVTVPTEPAEASALGNMINPFITLNEIENLEEARIIIKNSSQTKEYTPALLENIQSIKANYKQLKTNKGKSK